MAKRGETSLGRCDEAHRQLLIKPAPVILDPFMPRIRIKEAASWGLLIIVSLPACWFLKSQGFPAAYLATSPGGLDSVVLIAMSSEADIPFVVAVQTLRLFAVILIGPTIARLICRYA